MMKTKRMARWLSGFLAVLLLMASIFVPAYATSPTPPDDDEASESGSASFYKAASVAATWFSDTMAKDASTSFTNVTMNTAGGLLGFSDEADSDGIVQNFFQEVLSTSSATVSYQAFEGLTTADEDGEEMSGRVNGFTQYARFGHMLKRLGLDKTAAEGFAGTLTRSVSGGLVFLVYGLSALISKIFELVINLLKTLNPFSWMTIKSDGLILWEGSGDSQFAAIGQLVSNLYNQFASLSWTVLIPLSLAMLIATLLLARSTDKKAKLKRFVLRMVIIVGCIPVCGMSYTKVLDYMSDYMSHGNGATTYIVASTFIDFERWAQRGFIMNDDVNLVWSSTNGASTNTYRTLRQNTLAINRASNAVYVSDTAGFGGADNNAQWNELAMQESLNSTHSSTSSGVFSLLNRYMNGDFYNASDFATYYKGQLPYEDLKEALDITSSIEEFKDGYEEQFGRSGTSQLVPNGALWGPMKPGEMVSGSYTYGGAGGAMSPMAVYNYLSTDFTDSGLTIYSNEKASSGFVRKSHYSVNMIGSGLTSFAYWLNCMSLCGFMCLVGLLYAFGMIFGSMTRSFKVISNLPFAALGTLQAGAKIITQVIMMVIEIVGTIFAYEIVSQIAIAVVGFFEGNITSIAGTILPGMLGTQSNVPGMTSLILTGNIVVVIPLLFSSILYIFFAFKACKWRKEIIKSLDEMAAGIVNKFFEVQERPQATQPGLGHALAGGIASGIGSSALRGLTSGDKGGAGGVYAGDAATEGGVGEAAADAADAVGSIAAGDDADAGDAAGVAALGPAAEAGIAAEERAGAAVLGGSSLDDDIDSSAVSNSAIDAADDTSVDSGDTDIVENEGDTEINELADGSGIGGDVNADGDVDAEGGSGIVVAGDEAGFAGGKGGVAMDGAAQAGAQAGVKSGPKTKEMAAGEKYGGDHVSADRATADGTKNAKASTEHGGKAGQLGPDGKPIAGGQAGPGGQGQSSLKKTSTGDVQKGQQKIGPDGKPVADGTNLSASGKGGAQTGKAPAKAPVAADGRPISTGGGNSPGNGVQQGSRGSLGRQGGSASVQSAAQSEHEKARMADVATTRELQQLEAQAAAAAKQAQTKQMGRMVAGAMVGATIGAATGNGGGVAAGALAGAGVGALGVKGATAMGVAVAGQVARGEGVNLAKASNGKLTAFSAASPAAEVIAAGGSSAAVGSSPAGAPMAQGVSGVRGPSGGPSLTVAGSSGADFAAQVANGYRADVISHDVQDAGTGFGTGGMTKSDLAQMGVDVSRPLSSAPVEILEPGVTPMANTAELMQKHGAYKDGDVGPNGGRVVNADLMRAVPDEKLPGAATAGCLSDPRGMDTQYAFNGGSVTGRSIVTNQKALRNQMMAMKQEIDTYGDPTGEKQAALLAFQSDYNAVMQHQTSLAGPNAPAYKPFNVMAAGSDRGPKAGAAGPSGKTAAAVRQASDVPAGMPRMSASGTVDWSSWDSKKYTKVQAQESLLRQQTELLKKSQAAKQARINELRQQLGQSSAAKAAPVQKKSSSSKWTSGARSVTKAQQPRHGGPKTVNPGRQASNFSHKPEKFDDFEDIG